MIKIEGLVKSYGTNAVLRSVDLHVQPGEFVTLVGPNGAGKTTMMRIVATLLKANGGSVKIGGWPLPDHADKVRRHIGLVSHYSLLYGDLTAAENLMFFARLYQLEDRHERAIQALQTVGLAARQRDPVRSFSRGMVQRLTLARATLHEPDVLLFDEPYTGLDQDAARLLDDLLTGESEKGRTIFMITHDLTRGLNLCHRIAILSRGRIAQVVERETVTTADFMKLYTDTTRARKRVRRRSKGDRAAGTAG